MKIKDTLMITAGVFRCCIGTFSKRLEENVEIGQKKNCENCKESFTLIAGDKPTWIPDWQIKK